MPIAGFQLHIPPKKNPENINPHSFIHVIEYKELGGSKYTSTLKYETGVPVLDLEIEKKIASCSVMVISNIEKTYQQFIHLIEIQYVQDSKD